VPQRSGNSIQTLGIYIAKQAKHLPKVTPSLLIGAGVAGLVLVPSLFGSNAPRAQWPIIWLSMAVGIGLIGAGIGVAIAQLHKSNETPSDDGVDRRLRDLSFHDRRSRQDENASSAIYGVGCFLVAIAMAVGVFFYFLFTGGFC
jgi:hypothetical protein